MSLLSVVTAQILLKLQILTLYSYISLIIRFHDRFYFSHLSSSTFPSTDSCIHSWSPSHCHWFCLFVGFFLRGGWSLLTLWIILSGVFWFWFLFVCLCVCLFEDRFLFLTSLGCPRTYSRSACLCLPGAAIKGAHYHSPASLWTI